jgi:hypothetical protein
VISRTRHVRYVAGYRLDLVHECVAHSRVILFVYLVFKK